MRVSAHPGHQNVDFEADLSRPGFCGEALTPDAQLSSDSRRDNLIDQFVRLYVDVIMH
jgi:hypothetical protein